MNNYQQMNTSVVKNTAIVALSSLGGSIVWNLCRDIYNYHIHNKMGTEIKNMTHFNFGTFFGFTLGISYVYTGQPFIHHFIRQSKRQIVCNTSGLSP